MPSYFEFHNLDNSFSRKNFDCGNDALNQFLKTKARVNQSAGFNRTFVAISSGDAGKEVLGYYSLNMSEVSLASLPEEQVKKLPRHPIPVVRMGRLAVDSRSKGKGLGKLLLVDAMLKIQEASKQVGVYALVVDAKDNAAASFYLKFGFTPFANEILTLFLPLSSFPD